MVEKNIRLKTHVGNGVYDTLHPETNSKIVRVGNKNLDETFAEVTAQLAQTRVQGLIPVTHFDVVGDGITDDTKALQDYVDLMESSGLPYMYLPNFEQDYLISDSIKFTDPDVRIFGDKGMQMLHPSNVTKKKGNIIVKNTATSAFDIGNHRTKDTSNVPAGSWVVEGLSFKIPEGATWYSSNGVVLSGMQAGPDRPILLNKLSLNYLKNAIYMPKAEDDVTIMTANLKITNVSAYHNQTAIKLEGPVYGATITNNNLEGNKEGCVVGNFNGWVNISENMLENTKNPIVITTNEGGSMDLVSKGNYFEYHPTSDFLYHIDTGVWYAKASIEISENITSGGIDHIEYPVVVTGDSRVKIKDSQFKVLFEKSRVKVTKGSELLKINGGFYAFKQLGGNPKYLESNDMMIYMDSGFHYTDYKNEWVHDYPTVNSSLLDTPIGQTPVSDLADGITINQPIRGAGEELVVVNLMVKANGRLDGGSSSVNLLLRTKNDGFIKNIVGGTSNITNDMSDGEWVMVSIPLVISNYVNEFVIKVPETARGKILVGGATSKNYDFYNNTDDIKINKIYPVRPNVKTT